MKDQQQPIQGRKLASYYQSEATSIIASVSSALGDLGQVGKKQSAIAASLASALNSLTASMAKAFDNPGSEDKFLQNADRFRGELKRKLEASLSKGLSGSKG